MRFMHRKRLLLFGGATLAIAAALGGGLLLGKIGKIEEPEDVGLFCGEHGVPEKYCTLCHGELSGELPMCAEHGLPEAICTICHPENRERYGITGLCSEHGLPRPFCPKCGGAPAEGEAPGDWCREHRVPRPLCTRCDPELEKTLARCERHLVPYALCVACRPELKGSFPVCGLHRLPLSLCESAECRRALPPAPGAETGTALPIVRLPGPDVLVQAGIETSPVSEASVVPLVRAQGEVAYDETRLARLRSRVSGVVSEVPVQEGDAVEAGQVLAIIDSADLGEAKADYMAVVPIVDLWSRTLERQRDLLEKNIGAAKAVAEAEAELRRAEAQRMKARERLRSLGLGDAEIARLPDEDERERSRFRILSPLRGTVVRRRSTVGEAVEPASELFTVADLDRMWVHLQVRESDLRRIEPGQAVGFRVPALSVDPFPGKVAWVDTEVNDRTRLVRVRVEVENRGRLLRANMFGTGEIQVGSARTSLLVPRAAIQWEGSSFVVFLRRGPAEFEPRRVLVGQDVGGLVELAWSNLKPGDEVGTTGSFLLKTEILKGSIGAGCCE
jgi:cobalt-zinc-cadmium efflux system membrane fusion protein